MRIQETLSIAHRYERQSEAGVYRMHVRVKVPPRGRP